MPTFSIAGATVPVQDALLVHNTILRFSIVDDNNNKCKKTAVYTNVNGDIVSYTSKTAKIKKGDITQQHIAKCHCVVK